MIELSKSDRAMIRCAAGDLDTAGVQNLEAKVVALLTKQIGNGTLSHITRNNVRAAIAQVTDEGK
ncbi:hypothetical protein [Bradyrhizobium elkanii]|uniref:hypothetical protein n=1 Tax=Bradyrhizobium elkanii TaxID=29448 RepID=UPI00272BFDF7|nr:hypothetical protein [Bradyrhizobium elkanii]WLA79002.1 hypothetical protein QNJ99_26695 [Bradyrhizobium elkanii]WLA79004.1 hypothetical protein QNJ99_26705 [Bradyrhizobium elkanii]